MKKLLLIFLFLGCCGSIMADQMLQIVKADGSTHTINLIEEPQTSYVDGNLVIQTLSAEITYPLETVHKFVYISGTEGIQDVKGNKFEISRDGKMLIFSGLEKDTEAMVFSTSGLLMRRVPIAANTSTCISLEHLPLGVYVINVDGITYKILNR